MYLVLVLASSHFFLQLSECDDPIPGIDISLMGRGFNPFEATPVPLSSGLSKRNVLKIDCDDLGGYQDYLHLMEYTICHDSTQTRNYRWFLNEEV